MGRRPLRRYPIRRRTRPTQSDPRHRRYPPHASRYPVADHRVSQPIRAASAITNFEIILRHKAILELILDMRKKTENISSRFKVKNPDKQKTSRTQDSTSLLVYESYCAILDLNELSDEVKEFYRTQLGNFCKARNMVVQEANAINQDFFTRWFVQKRIKDMQARISNYASS